MSHITTHFFTISLSLSRSKCFVLVQQTPTLFLFLFPWFQLQSCKTLQTSLCCQDLTDTTTTHPTDCSQYLEQLFHTLLFKIPNMDFAHCGYTCVYLCVYVCACISLSLSRSNLPQLFLPSELQIVLQTLICKPHKDFNTRVFANKSTKKTEQIQTRKLRPTYPVFEISSKPKKNYRSAALHIN